MQDVRAELTRIEAVLRAVVERLDGRTEMEEALGVLTAGLVSYRRSVLDEAAQRRDAGRLADLLERMAQDARLRFPHRKLIERLFQHREAATGAFRAIPFSRLVRLAQVGKSRAKAYLAELESLGYVSRRHDGYRTWFCLRAPQAGAFSSRREASS